MSALFDIFVMMVAALASAAFAHFGAMTARAGVDASAFEVSRTVKRSPVVSPPSAVVIARVAR